MYKIIHIFSGSVKQDFQLSNRLEEKVINDCMDVINQNRKNIELSYKIDNLQRTFGATLSYYISLKHQEQGILSFCTIRILFRNSRIQPEVGTLFSPPSQ